MRVMSEAKRSVWGGIAFLWEVFGEVPDQLCSERCVGGGAGGPPYYTPPILKGGVGGMPPPFLILYYKDKGRQKISSNCRFHVVFCVTSPGDTFGGGGGGGHGIKHIPYVSTSLVISQVLILKATCFPLFRLCILIFKSLSLECSSLLV